MRLCGLRVVPGHKKDKHPFSFMVDGSFTRDEGPCALPPSLSLPPGRQASRNHAVPCGVTASWVERGDIMMASVEQTGRRCTVGDDVRQT
jgi:hypothetical protein